MAMHKFRRILGKILATPVLGVIAWTAGGALIWATGGLIFGVFFGAVSALVHGEPWRVVSIGAYFALCGAAAGTVLGAIRATCDSHNAYAGSDDWEASPPQSERVAVPDVKTRKPVAGPPAAKRRFDEDPPVRGGARAGTYTLLQH
jgi:hypothetical protein